MSRTTPGAARPLLRHRYQDDNFGLVLVTVAITVCWTAIAPSTQWAGVIVDVLQATMLFGALRVASVGPRALRIAVVVWIAATAAGIATTIAPSDWTTAVGQLFGLGLIAAALAAILHRLVTHPVIAWATVQGAVAAYLMIGLFFAYAYFAMADLGPNPPLEGVNQGELNPFLYFSFVTMTTVGYGDITPISDLARSAAMAEAVIGQLYLVTVVALAVSNIQAEGRRAARRAEAEEAAANLGEPSSES